MGSNFFNNRQLPAQQRRVKNRRDADKLIHSSYTAFLLLGTMALHDQFGFGGARLGKGKKVISTAKAIKKTREAQGMTQKELAERCGYTVTDIKAYELGEKEPKHINLMTIAGALGVTMYEMFERMEEIEEPENINLDVIRNALSAYKAIVKTPLDQVAVMALKELIQYKETGLTPDEINGMKKRHEKIDLMATEYDNICEKYDKLYGKEQM